MNVAKVFESWEYEDIARVVNWRILAISSSSALAVYDAVQGAVIVGFPALTNRVAVAVRSEILQSLRDCDNSFLSGMVSSDARWYIDVHLATSDDGFTERILSDIDSSVRTIMEKLNE